MNQHKLVVNLEMIHQDFKLDPDHQLFRQMTRLTKDRGSLRHDDLLDALAIAVNYWVERMDRDMILSALESQNAALDQELEAFMENTVGRKPTSNSWI